MLLMKITRTAGPLGGLFGFSIDFGKCWFSFNAGWYILSMGINAVVNVYISKFELTAWIEGTDGISIGSEPERNGDECRQCGCTIWRTGECACTADPV